MSCQVLKQVMISTYLQELEILLKASPNNCPTIILGDFNYIINKGVCQIVASPFTLKSILRQKKELWKLKYFTMQNYT